MRVNYLVQLKTVKKIAVFASLVVLLHVLKLPPKKLTKLLTNNIVVNLTTNNSHRRTMNKIRIQKSKLDLTTSFH